MKSLVLGLSFLGACAGAILATSATAQENDGTIMYERYYYDDPEMTVQVGYNRDTCTFYGVGSGPTDGRYGPYVASNPISRCVGGELQPF